MKQENLPDEYLTLDKKDIDRRIGEAKKMLGNSLVILGQYNCRLMCGN